MPRSLRYFFLGIVLTVLIGVVLVEHFSLAITKVRASSSGDEKIATTMNPTRAAPRSSPIQTLMETADIMGDMPFREVVLAASGHQVLPVDPASQEDRLLLEHLSRAFDALLLWLNAPDSPTHGLRRINEASSYVENELHRLLTEGDFTCSIPLSSTGKAQRSGYPDLQITHRPTGRVTYLDPKLFEVSSRASTLRTFYYQPDTITGKVQYDARHLLVGFSHNGDDGVWKFLGWELIDLHDFHVKLKTEFQGSNKNLYQDKLTLKKSR